MDGRAVSHCRPFHGHPFLLPFLPYFFISCDLDGMYFKHLIITIFLTLRTVLPVHHLGTPPICLFTVSLAHPSALSLTHPLTNLPNSPDYPAVSPDHTVVSPDHSVVSPDHSAVSPDYSVVSPDHSVVSPDHSVISPDQSARWAGSAAFPQDENWA